MAWRMVSLSSSTGGSCSPTDSSNGVPDQKMSSRMYCTVRGNDQQSQKYSKVRSTDQLAVEREEVLQNNYSEKMAMYMTIHKAFPRYNEKMGQI